MANKTTAIGTLLLLGVAFLTMNALAVSARPGDGTLAEKTIVIAVATTPDASASGAVVATGGLVAVPVPSPSENSTLDGSIRDLTTALDAHPVVSPTLPADIRVTLSPGLGGVSRESPLPGVTPPSVESSPSRQPGNGLTPPGFSPVPVPPVSADPGTVSQDPVRNAL